MSQINSIDRPTFSDVQYPSFTRMTDTFPSLVVEELDADSPEARLIIDNVHSLQNEITTFVADDTAGLELGLIQAFMRKAGVVIEPYHVVSAEQLDMTADLLRRSYVTRLEDVYGLYSPYIRMSLIKRDHLAEALYGTQATERVIVHELAHSGSIHDHIQFSGRSAKEILRNTHMPRLGNRFVPYAPAAHEMRGKIVEGALAEEAYAEMKAAKYIALAFDTALPADEDVGFTFEHEGRRLWLPARYVDHVQLGKDEYRARHSTPALAAYAFEIFNSIDPAIVPLMRRGRYDPTAYIEIDQRLDAMGVDGLSKVMKESVYTLGGFVAALEIAEFVAHEHGIVTRPKFLPLPTDIHHHDGQSSDFSFSYSDSLPDNSIVATPSML